MKYSAILDILEDTTPLIGIHRSGAFVKVNRLTLDLLQCDEQFIKSHIVPMLGNEHFLADLQKAQSWNKLEPIFFENQVLHLDVKFVAEDVQEACLFFVLRFSDSSNFQAQQLNLLQSITRNIHDGLYRTTEDGRFLYVNKSFCDIFGIQKIEDVKHLRSTDLYVDPNQRTEYQPLLKAKGALKNLEILLKRLDGKIFWGLISVCRSIGQNGQVFYDGIIRDNTEFKGIERQLKIEKQNAEDASKAKEMFLSTMSHELRTPMNAVIGLTHLLLESNPAPAQEESLRTLQFSAENLLHIINNILDFSKIESGKVELEQEEFSIQDLLLHIVELFKLKAKAKELDLVLHLDEALNIRVIGDSTRLSQIFNNLISNAIKFTYHGEVTISASVLNTSEYDQLVRFEISDTGIGIPDDKKKLIFGMFTQANSNTTRKFGGTGLGLAITKRIVELHGSTLNLVSTPGHGSRFFFDVSFKLATDSSYKQTEVSPPVQKTGMQNALKGVKIMVVEDNEVNQILLKKFTQIWGAEMTLAENGLEATEVIEMYNPDIVLMDLQMPIMDGYEASKIIRKMPAFKDLPILAVTASVLLDVQARIKDAGMTDYVCKPFKPEDLLHKIKMLVTASR